MTRSRTLLTAEVKPHARCAQRKSNSTHVTHSGSQTLRTSCTAEQTPHTQTPSAGVITPFPQPLPSLLMAKIVSWLTVFPLCSNGRNFVAENQNYIWAFLYKRPHCLRQHKSNQHCLNRDWTSFVLFCSSVCLFACLFLFCFLLTADSLSGQLRGDKECPFSGARNCGRIWRKMPESDGWSVSGRLTSCDANEA